MELIIAIIVLSGIIGSISSNKSKAGQGGQRQYEKTDQRGASTRAEGVDDAWGQLKKRIEEAAGVSPPTAPGTAGPARYNTGKSASRAPRQRGGSSPRHQKITSDTSQRTGNLIRTRIDETRNTTSVTARRAEIAESVAYWEANRAHMQAINDDFNNSIDRQQRELRQGMKAYKVEHSR